MVDAVSGKILHRHNQVDNADGRRRLPRQHLGRRLRSLAPLHAGRQRHASRSLAVSVGVPVDDHVVKIFDPKGNLLVAGDLGTNPEPRRYQSSNDPGGHLSAQVCPYDNPTVPANVGPYSLTVAWSNTAAAPRRAT